MHKTFMVRVEAEEHDLAHLESHAGYPLLVVRTILDIGNLELASKNPIINIMDITNSKDLRRC